MTTMTTIEVHDDIMESTPHSTRSFLLLPDAPNWLQKAVKNANLSEYGPLDYRYEAGEQEHPTTFKVWHPKDMRFAALMMMLVPAFIVTFGIFIVSDKTDNPNAEFHSWYLFWYGLCIFGVIASVRYMIIAKAVAKYRWLDNPTLLEYSLYRYWSSMPVENQRQSAPVLQRIYDLRRDYVMNSQELSNERARCIKTLTDYINEARKAEQLAGLSPASPVVALESELKDLRAINAMTAKEKDLSERT